MATPQRNAFITGNSSGLGRGLTEALLEGGWRVFGISRRGCGLAGNIVDARGDLADLCEKPDPDAFPALQRIRDARGTEVMPGPREAAERVLGVLAELRAFESGSYVDIRRIIAPEEYENLLKSSKAAPRG